MPCTVPNIDEVNRGRSGLERGLNKTDEIAYLTMATNIACVEYIWRSLFAGTGQDLEDVN
jgi:hypothetical protein